MIEIDKSVLERIEKAAKQIYEENNRERFPTVDAVRRLAKVDMNTASLAMRSWRRQQLSRSEIATVDVPNELSDVFAHSVKSIWEQAQSIANESLKLAQQSWEKERQEAEELTAEISNAFDDQASRLEEVLEENKNTRDQIKELSLEKEMLLKEIQSTKDALATTKEQLAEKVGAINAYKDQLSILTNLVESKETPSDKTK